MQHGAQVHKQHTARPPPRPRPRPPPRGAHGCCCRQAAPLAWLELLLIENASAGGGAGGEGGRGGMSEMAIGGVGLRGLSSGEGPPHRAWFRQSHPESPLPPTRSPGGGLAQGTQTGWGPAPPSRRVLRSQGLLPSWAAAGPTGTWRVPRTPQGPSETGERRPLLCLPLGVTRGPWGSPAAPGGHPRPVGSPGARGGLLRPVGVTHSRGRTGGLLLPGRP